MMNELQTTRIYNTLAGVVAIESALLAIAVIITALYLWLVRCAAQCDDAGQFGQSCDVCNCSQACMSGS